jgi:hypothetical protein
MTDTELQPQPLPPGIPVRVNVPASVLFDLEKFQRAQASVLGHAGCPTCTSGLNLHWKVFSDYEVDHSGAVRPVSARGVQ